MGVGVVGAGRVGAVLGHAVAAVGHAVVGASGTSEETRERMTALLPGVPRLGVEDVLERSELVLLTVPDDDLGPLVGGLARLGAFREGQIVVHTAGRHGTAVLEPAARAGAIPLAIHPAMTFTGTAVDLPRLVGTTFAVTADPAVLPIAQALVVELGGEPVVLAEEERPLYHAALAHGANHLVTVVAQARAALGSAGVADPGPVLGPLVHAAADGALRRGDAALTGPVARGDVETLAAHLEALRGVDDADVLPTYRALATATAVRARRAGRIGERRSAAVRDALAGRSAADPTGRPEVVRTVAGLRARPSDRRRAVVMTMGALHEGHLALVRRAREIAEEVVVTVFVNPLQFGPGEDLERYPRDLDADLTLLTEVGGVDVVFAPSAAEVYPDGTPQVRVVAGPGGDVLEGAARPGHFDGVLTVVAKLTALTRADVAVFGRKDAQQLALVRRMVRDLDTGVEVVGAPTVRETDGLALSSRNRYLDAPERAASVALPDALRAGVRAAAEGPHAALAAARTVLAAASPLVRRDYLELVDPDSLLTADQGGADPTLLVVAARVGSTRLIDNADVGPRAAEIEAALLRGGRAGAPVVD